MQHYSGELPALSTLIFSKYTSRPKRRNPVKGTGGVPAERGRKHRQVDAANGAPPTGSRDPTTSFLTATTLIYAIGAGITAAAGTRLALQ